MYSAVMEVALFDSAVMNSAVLLVGLYTTEKMSSAFKFVLLIH